MPRTLRAALIQASCDLPGDGPIGDLKRQMVAKTLRMVEDASARGASIVCLQELFYAPYFPAEQTDRWFELAEEVGDGPGGKLGPTLRVMQELGSRLGVALIVPVMEKAGGVYYNTAAVFDERGVLLGKYRKTHLPHCHPGFWEKYYFRPGNLGYPVFSTRGAKIGVYICYDRHFPEGARELGLNGAEIVFNPSATVAGLSEHLWSIEQPAHAVANQYFVGAINRVGRERPWGIGEFYGSSYFCDPRGQVVARASRDRDEALVADLDLDLIDQVRHTWQFYRDRRPETYARIARQDA